MRDTSFDPEAIAADAVALAGLPGGTGHEGIRIDWLQRRLADAPGSRHVDAVGNLVWTFASIVTGAEQLRAVLQEVLD